MAGPVYQESSNAYYGESLVYRCMQCGFIEHKPTLSSGEGMRQRILDDMLKKLEERHGKG